MHDQHKQALVALMIEQQVLKFGEFTLKSGRVSPYFFNLGAIGSGASIASLGIAYARRILQLDFNFDVLFGPAYKGIPIVVAAAQALAQMGADVGWVFNRKEAKDHGEGGRFVGAPLQGRVVLVDDVLTAGTAVREAAELIKAAGAELAGVVIALDRQEVQDRSDSSATAVTRLQADLGIPVVSMLSLQDVIEYLDLKPDHDKYRREVVEAIKRYQDAYCVRRP
ncbi:MAG: orotate phosphoribosyltransferase [Gammaproteobacteria bacterium]|nr:orotate phosphoribosyltransferase [Gammaproteobacteria bacterium]